MDRGFEDETLDRAMDGDGTLPADVAAAVDEAFAHDDLSPQAIDVYAAWMRTAHAHGIGAPAVHRTGRSPRTAPLSISPARKTWRRAVAYASAAAIALVAGTAAWRAFQHDTAPLVVRDYATTAAQRAAVDLPDGSRVVLAPETRLRYATQASGARVVTLDGEAYFTVTHDSDHPFVVSAGHVTTQVLGTTFSVRHYTADPSVRVAVLDGKVATGGQRGRAVLTEGMLAHVTDSTAVPTRADVRALVEWTSGKLVFKDAPIPEVLASVSRWCGYDIRLADSAMASDQITTTLLVGDPGKTIRMLEEVLDVRATISGNVVTLRASAGTRKSSAPAPSRRSSNTHAQEVGK